VTVELVRETWPGKIFSVTIGATAAEGGTRSTTVTIGGHAALPFLPTDAPKRRLSPRPFHIHNLYRLVSNDVKIDYTAFPDVETLKRIEKPEDQKQRYSIERKMKRSQR